MKSSSIEYQDVSDATILRRHDKVVRIGLGALLLAGMLPGTILCLVWNQESQRNHSDEPCDAWTPNMTQALKAMGWTVGMSVAWAAVLLGRIVHDKAVAPWTWAILVAVSWALVHATIRVEAEAEMAFFACKFHDDNPRPNMEWWLYLMFSLPALLWTGAAWLGYRKYHLP